MVHGLYVLVFLLLAFQNRRHASRDRFAMAQIAILKKKFGHSVILSPEQRQWLLSIGA